MSSNRLTFTRALIARFFKCNSGGTRAACHAEVAAGGSRPKYQGARRARMLSNNSELAKLPGFF